MAKSDNTPGSNVQSTTHEGLSTHIISKASPAQPETKSQVQHIDDTLLESQLRPPLAQFVVNFVLQIAAFAAAIAFGIFAVKSVREAITANEYAERALDAAQAALDAANTANKLTLLTLCLSSEGTVLDIKDLCEPVVNGTGSSLPRIISDIFPSATAPSGPSGPGAAGGVSRVVIGVVIGIIVGLLVVGLGAWTIARRNRIRSENGFENSTPRSPAGEIKTIYVDSSTTFFSFRDYIYANRRYIVVGWQ